MGFKSTQVVSGGFSRVRSERLRYWARLRSWSWVRADRSIAEYYNPAWSQICVFIVFNERWVVYQNTITSWSSPAEGQSLRAGLSPQLWASEHPAQCFDRVSEASVCCSFIVVGKLGTIKLPPALMRWMWRHSWANRALKSVCLYCVCVCFPADCSYLMFL